MLLNIYQINNFKISLPRCLYFLLNFSDGESNWRQLRLQRDGAELQHEPGITEGEAADALGNRGLTQQQIKNISNELNNHKKEVQILRSEKDTLESVLTMKTADVKKSLSNELVRIEE